MCHCIRNVSVIVVLFAVSYSISFYLQSLILSAYSRLISGLQFMYFKLDNESRICTLFIGRCCLMIVNNKNA